MQFSKGEKARHIIWQKKGPDKSRGQSNREVHVRAGHAAGLQRRWDAMIGERPLGAARSKTQQRPAETRLGQQAIAPAFGDQQTRVRRVRLNLLPQAIDVRL